MIHYCGWKDKDGNVQELEKIEAPSYAHAKYKYIREHLFKHYPELKGYKATSILPFIYTSIKEPPPRKQTDIKESDFYKLVAVD